MDVSAEGVALGEHAHHALDYRSFRCSIIRSLRELHQLGAIGHPALGTLAGRWPDVACEVSLLYSGPQSVDACVLDHSSVEECDLIGDRQIIEHDDLLARALQLEDCHALGKGATLQH